MRELKIELDSEQEFLISAFAEASGKSLDEAVKSLLVFGLEVFDKAARLGGFEEISDCH